MGKDSRSKFPPALDLNTQWELFSKTSVNLRNDCRLLFKNSAWDINNLFEFSRREQSHKFHSLRLFYYDCFPLLSSLFMYICYHICILSLISLLLTLENTYKKLAEIPMFWISGNRSETLSISLSVLLSFWNDSRHKPQTFTLWRGKSVQHVLAQPLNLALPHQF